MENFVVGGGKISPGTLDKKLCNSCTQEREEGKPKNFPLGKGGA